MTEHRRWVIRHVDPVTGLRRGYIRWPDGSPPDPYGCRWCGYPKAIHQAIYTIYVSSVGDHQWVTPTNEQIYARMVARRDHRHHGRATLT